MSSTKVTRQKKPWQAELKAAFEATDAAKKILMKYYGRLRFVSEKPQEGLVSEADQKSEEAIRKIILKRFRSHSIMGEEQGLNTGKKSSSLWIVDPLDGTTNYIYGLPFFCISIGLQVEGKMVVGVIDAPLLKWRFWATQGGGAYLNRRRIAPSQRGTINEGLFATGFAYHYGEFDLDQQFRIMRQIVMNARGVRRAGSAALDLCMVACGIFDGYWEGSLKPWDSAAGSLICTEAGAVVSNYRGAAFKPEEMPDVLAANPKVHPKLIELIGESL